VADELLRRWPVTRQAVEDGRDMEDLAWKNAVLDLYVKTMQVMTRLGIWVAIVFLVQVALLAGVAYLIWRTL
jgi:hypothetical protein